VQFNKYSIKYLSTIYHFFFVFATDNKKKNLVSEWARHFSSDLSQSNQKSMNPYKNEWIYVILMKN